MRLSKRQLKRIIREEYSQLKRRGLIKENNPNSRFFDREQGAGRDMLGELITMVGEVDEFESSDEAYDVITGVDPSFEDFCGLNVNGGEWDAGYDELVECIHAWADSIPAAQLENDCERMVSALEQFLGM